MNQYQERLLGGPDLIPVPERKQSTIRRALSIKKKPVADNGEEKEKLIQERR